MIKLTRLDGREVVINSDLVVTVEATPDTVVTLTTGDRIMVKENVEDVIERAVAFRHRVLQGPGGGGDLQFSRGSADAVDTDPEKRGA